jgi:predicted lipid carrier protein YhbT
LTERAPAAVTVCPVAVRLDEGASSGLACIVQQYLEQDFAEFEKKRRRAARLRGRIAMTAADHDVTVTLDFKGSEIVISDGESAPVDASITGPYEALVRLLQGKGHPLLEHLRGRLRVRSCLRRPLLPLSLHRLMKLNTEDPHVGRQI